MPFARMVWAAATCASLAAVPVSADQTVAPIPLRPPSIVHLGSPWLATLRRIAATGDGARLGEAVFETLADLQGAGIGEGCCDPSRDYFLVTFVGADAAGAPAIITALAHDPTARIGRAPGRSRAGPSRVSAVSRRRSDVFAAGDVRDLAPGESVGKGERRLCRGNHRPSRAAAGYQSGRAGNARSDGAAIRHGRRVRPGGAAGDRKDHAPPDGDVRASNGAPGVAGRVAEPRPAGGLRRAGSSEGAGGRMRRSEHGAERSRRRDDRRRGVRPLAGGPRRVRKEPFARP